MTLDPKTHLPLDEARELVQGAMLNLAATGNLGFEGFIRDALVEFSGATMRLAKSGPQDGVDGSSNSLDGALAIGVEAKRYKAEHRLKLDDLTAKLSDAADREFDPIDLWVLVASNEVSANDVPKLQRKGDKKGVGVLVLDWRSEGASLSKLQLLVSKTPNAVEYHLKNAHVIEAANSLSHYATDSEFESFRKELASPELGFTNAAKQVERRLRSALDNRRNASARLGSPVDVLSNEKRWLSRSGCMSKLNRWRANTLQNPVAVVLGEEGAGKTAATLQWAISQLDGDHPLMVLFVAARDLTSGSLEETLAVHLARWTESRDAAYWVRRLRKWRRFRHSENASPHILLVLDGINEGDSQHLTRSVFAEAVSDDWLGILRVVATGRKGHWERSFRNRFEAYSAVQEIVLDQFELAELDALLGTVGRSRSEFPSELIEIIRWPSWFSVAETLFDAVDDWSIYTREQLMLEYWAHRSRALGRIGAPQVEEFRDFVEALGRRSLREEKTAPLSKTELRGLLSEAGGEDSTAIDDALQDVVDGIWMQPSSTNKFVISEQLLPFAIALALLDELRTCPSFEEVDAHCDAALAPFEDRDIGVSILKAATVLAVSSPSATDHVRSVLFLRWALQHNFGHGHFELFWKSARHSCEVVLDCAQRCWLGRSGGTHTDEILVKAIANLAEEGGENLSLVQSFIEKWFATYWLDPLEGLLISRIEDDEQKRDRITKTKERWEELQPPLSRLFGDQVALVEYEDGVEAGWLLHRLFSVLSYLPRAPFKFAIRNWVITRALLDEPHDFDELAWVLRFNQCDPEETSAVVLEVANLFVGERLAVLRKATRWLLEAHGGEQCGALALALREADRTSPNHVRHTDYEILEDVITFRPEAGERLRGIVLQLEQLVFRPSLQISNDDRQRVLEFVRSIDLSKVAIGRNSTSEDHDFNHALTVLVRWFPDQLEGTIQSFLKQIELRSGDDEIWGYAFRIRDFYLFINSSHRDHIQPIVRARNVAESDGGHDVATDFLTFALLFDQSSDDQLEVWNEVGIPQSFNLDFKRFQKPMSEKQVVHLADHLRLDTPNAKIRSWLHVLQASGRQTHIPSAWPPLARLLHHEDDEVRYAAFEVAAQTDDSAYGQALLDSGWTYEGEAKGCQWPASLVMIKAADRSNFDDIASRIFPASIGLLWRKFDYAPECSGPFSDFADRAYEQELEPVESRSFGGVTYYHLHALEHLIPLEPDKHEKRARHLLKHAKFLDGAIGEWPIREYLEYYCDNEPDTFLQLWELTHDRVRHGHWRHQSFEQLPFRAPADPSILKLRESLLMEAKDDWELMELCRSINRNEVEEWAIEWVKETLNRAKNPAAQARALTVAGFVNPTQAARDCWSELRSVSFQSKWLSDVRAQALTEHDKQIALDRWLDQLLAAHDDVSLFAAWLIIRQNAELNALPRIFKVIDEQARKSMLGRHFTFISAAYQSVIDQAKRGKFHREKTLFFTTKGPRAAFPWSG